MHHFSVFSSPVFGTNHLLKPCRPLASSLALTFEGGALYRQNPRLHPDVSTKPYHAVDSRPPLQQARLSDGLMLEYILVSCQPSILCYHVSSCPIPKGPRMKRADVIDLIRFHSEHDDVSFNNRAAAIAREFAASGEQELASYVMSLISATRTFIPQMEEDGSSRLVKETVSDTPLPLPTPIANDIRGIVNAIAHKMGVNKFLFQGPPGTGKTESVRQLARILNRSLYSVDFNTLIDSKLGETQKNIAALFKEVNAAGRQAIVLFDEIDAVALDRINSNDVREMGRATSAVLKGLDTLADTVVLIATTNLFSCVDPALARRFDMVIDFDRYTHDDLVDVGMTVMHELAKGLDFIKSDARCFRKVLETSRSLPYPGELKNLIRTSIAFSDPANQYDYLVRVFEALNGEPPTVDTLQSRGFTVREMEVLTGVSRSTISRMMKGAEHE